MSDLDWVDSIINNTISYYYQSLKYEQHQAHFLPIHDQFRSDTFLLLDSVKYPGYSVFIKVNCYKN